MTVTITISAQFTDSNGTPATGLTLADIDITLISVDKAGGSETIIWNTQDPTRELTGIGMYQRDYTSADLEANWYFAMAFYGGASALDNDYVFGAVGEVGLDDVGRVDVGDWLGSAVALSAGNFPDVNIAEISDDSTAADNLELQYDTGGLTGDTFPATQAQVGNIASGTAATNTTAASVTVTTGVEVNSVTDTEILDGTVHEVNPSVGNTEFYYQFDVGANGVPVAIQWQGYANSNGDSYSIFAYNWTGASWQQVGTINGSNGSTVATETFDLTTAHVGTGANDGLVRWRVLSTDGTGFNTDRVLCSFATVFQSVGYSLGAIWVDTNASNTNTVNFVDGVADNPVSTWAAALTLSSQLSIQRFQIANGSTITLSANSDNFTLFGSEWTIALGGQSIASAHIEGATVSGTGTGADARFIDCKIGTVTLAQCGFARCAITDTVTLSAAGTYLFEGSFSAIAGSATPTVDFGAAVGNTALNMRHYSGGIEIENMGATGTDTMSLEGEGQLVLNANCTGGNISIRGHFTVTDNAGGAVTLSDDARYDVAQINAEADTALSDYDGPTNTEMEARTLLAASYGTAANQTNIETDTQDIQSRLPAALVGGAIDADVSSIQASAITAASIATDAITAAKIATDAIGAAELAADAVAEIADGVWDEILTGATHNIATSAGRRLRNIAGLTETDSAVDDPGAAATTTAFNTDLTEADDHWNDTLIVFTSGTLIGQAKPILDYANTNGAITLDEALTAAPADNDEFVIFSTHIHPIAQIQSGLATAANQTTMLGVIGALTDAAATGDPTTDTIMQYIKQLVNILVGSDGVATFPSSAAPGNNISLAEVIRAIYDDSNELQGDWANAGRLDAILDARASQTTADAIETDTQDIQSRLPSALVSGRMDSDIKAVDGNTTSAANLQKSTLTIVTGAAEAGTLSTTQMTTDLSEATANHYNGRALIWTSGVLFQQAAIITAYAASGGTLTYTTTTDAPSAADTFVIV